MSRRYTCNKCARETGALPRQSAEALRGTPQQKEQWKVHATSCPTKPKNGIFTDSDTNAQRSLRDEALACGDLEIEAGSTNIVHNVGRPIGDIEEHGIKTGHADGIRLPNSSRAAGAHPPYPIKIQDLGSRVCQVCGEPID